MKCLLSLLILTNSWYIIQVSGVLEWTVIGKVTEYGQDATLFCNVSHCCPKYAGWDKWTPVQQTLFIDLKTGRPNKKYDGKIYRDGYTLIIKNLTEKDLNVSYSCLYGATLGERKFLLKEDVFTYISTEQLHVSIGNRAFSKGEIAAVIFGVVVLLAVTAVCFYLLFWRHRHILNRGTAAYRLVMPEELENDCFLEDPSNVEFVEGEDAIMTCKIRSRSLPVKWMKDGNEIRQDENCQMYNEDSQYSLKLRNATTSDSGEYLVQVGQFSKKLNLMIRDCFPEDPPNDGNVDCFEGEDAIITCKIRPGSQPVKWMKAGNEIRQNENCKMYNEDSQYSLQLRDTKTSDSGEYCVKVGLLSRNLHLRIIGIPGEITKAERKTYMDAVQSGTEVRKYVRIQVIGKDRVGKTSLVHRLLGYKKHDGKSTDGIAIDRKCLIRESDGEWIIGDVVTERKKSERITAILQGDNNKGKGTKPSDASVISNEHVFDTKTKLDKKELNKIEEDNLLQKEKQNYKIIPIGEYQYRVETGMEEISTEKENDKTESLEFHEESDETNVTKFIPAAPKNSSEKSNSIIEDRFSSIEEKQSISKIPKENQMRYFEQKTNHSILSPQNQKPMNSDEADKLTGETNEKIDKILLRAKNKKEEMTLNGLVESGIWDFAGQKDYYATHQTFFTPHAIYLLVADIEDAITGTDDDENVNFDTIGDFLPLFGDPETTTYMTRVVTIYFYYILN